MAQRKTFVLLWILLAIYLVLGSFLFLYLEDTDDHSAHQHGNETYKEYMTRKYNISEEDYRKLLLMTRRERHAHVKWNFFSSLYFCGSVVTTIGYGHITPQSVGGKIACIFYAIFGIPLSLLVIKMAGEEMYLLTEKIIGKIERSYRKRPPDHLKRKTFLVTLFCNIAILFGGGYMYQKSENWSFIDGIYYCFTVYSTIGFGDLVPQEGHGIKKQTQDQILLLMIRILFLMTGLLFMSSLIAVVLNSTSDFLNEWKSFVDCCRQQSKRLSSMTSLLPGMFYSPEYRQNVNAEKFTNQQHFSTTNCCGNEQTQDV